MRIYLLLMLIVSGWQIAQSQPLVDQSMSRFPMGLNDTFNRVSTLDPLPTFPTSGTNLVWDFTGVSFSNTTGVQNTVVSPANTPYASSFPQANICLISILNGSTDTNFAYYTEDATKLEGVGSVSNGGANIRTCSDPNLLWKYPFAYAETVQDTSVCGTLPTQIVTKEYAGFGELRLPQMTVANCIMPKTVSGSFTSYRWFTATPRLRLVAFSTDISFVVNELPDLLTSVAQQEQEVKRWTVFPNPATETITLSVKSHPNETQLRVVSVQGQQQGEIQVLPASVRQHTLPVQGWAPGIYFAILESEQARQVIRMSVL